MSLFQRARTAPRTARRDAWPPFTDVTGMALPSRLGLGKQGAVTVTEDTAMRQSAVWAAVRLRADLVSTLPASCYRDYGGIPVEMTKPPIMVMPGGQEWTWIQWMWASQRDLDLSGNVIGLIKARNGVRTPFYPDGLPALIELQDTRSCSVIHYKGAVQYRIGGKVYNRGDVYHERQYPISGFPVGISPLINAAMTIGEVQSMQQFGLDWFSNGGVPKAWMRNTTKRLTDAERDMAKGWYQETIRNGDLMVTGRDWEYNMIQAETAGLEWVEGRRFGNVEIARFFGVPADLIDAAVSGQSITYANVTQRHLQFLVTSLGPLLMKREEYLTNLLPAPRYVELNADALLRLDPTARQAILRDKLETWQLTLDEARSLDGLEPLTGTALDTMQEIYGRPKVGGLLPAGTPVGVALPPPAPEPDPNAVIDSTATDPGVSPADPAAIGAGA